MSAEQSPNDTSIPPEPENNNVPPEPNNNVPPEPNSSYESSASESNASSVPSEPPDEENSNAEVTASTESSAESTNTPANALASGVEIAKGAEQEAEVAAEEEEDEEESPFYLGRRLQIVYTKKTKFSQITVQTTGRIYHISSAMIRIMPDGTSDRLYDFPLVDDDFDPDLGVKKLRFFGEPPRLPFVTLQGFRSGQTLVALDEKGDPIDSLVIESIQEEDDKFILKSETSGDTITIDSDFQGIPLDLPFSVLRVKPQIEEKQAEEAAVEGEAEGVEELEEELIEFELPQVAEYVELSKSEQIYPEITQKSSFLADLTNLFDAVSQKNPAVMKQLRTHVEMFSALKNSMIRRSPDGSVLGETQVSLLTLQDILQNRTVPLVKPVLESKRVLVGESSTQTEGVVAEDQVLTKRLDDLVEDSKEYLNHQGDTAAAQPGIGLPRWFQALQGYFDHYPMGDKFAREGYAFETDTEFFRHGYPGDGTIKGLGYGNPEEKKQGGFALAKNSVEDYIGPVRSSYRRGHGPTYHALEKGGIELSILPDRAPVKGYIIFPYRSVLTGVIGAIRTGSLWENIQRSMSRESTMNLVLELFGGVSLDDLDAQKIIYLDASTATAVQIQFTDYLSLLVKTLVLRGPGDLHAVKADLGIQESEFNVEQADIVQGRVSQVIDSIKTLIRQLRTETAPVTAEAKPLLDSEFMTFLQQSVAQHPKLNELLDAMRERLPGYKNIDMAAMGFLMVYAQDYLLAAIGGDPRAIKREFVRYQRDFLLKRDAELQMAINLKLEAGHAPVRNPCEHVNALTLCRKAPTANERIALLAKLLKKFTGGREENWIQCIVCEQHLVCHHETLQIKQFLHPREKDAIQKEIVLGYSGGAFGRNHICRNCGLPIAEMDFDTSMEYDDEGRPMSGREVMVDLDAIEDEQLAYMLGPRISAVTGITFETPAKQRIYGIARVLVDRVYVSFSEPTYVKLVNRAEGYLKQLIMTPEDYKKQTAAEADKKHLPYANYKSVREISTIAALVFLELQTKFPDYLVGAIVLGCKPGFGGYPLIADADPNSVDQSVGINYMVCAMTDIHRGTDEPWASGFQKWTVQKTRKETIQRQLVGRLQWILEHDTSIQQELQDKRDYLNKVYGEGAGTGKAAERLPIGFLPRMETSSEAAENAAKSPTEVGAKGALGEIQQSDTWIRAANKFAKDTAIVIQGSPYAETSCCSSQLTAPGGFWAEHKMPELPPFYTLKKFYKRQSILYPYYITRPLQESLGEPKLEEAYQVYLQICWRGPRMGLTHEFGYDHKCDWCELQIPTEYIYPDIFEDNASWGKAKRKQEAEKQQLYEQKLHSDLITSLTAQGIPIADPLAFQALLDAAHRRTEFRQYQSPDVMPTAQLVEKLRTIEPEPIPKWSELLDKTLENLGALDPTASGPEIAAAMTLRQGLYEAIVILKRELGNADTNRLAEITKLPAAELIEVIRSYFLIPFERVLDSNQFQALSLPYQYKKGKRSELHEHHVEMLESMLAVHTSYVKIYKELFEGSILANVKIAYAAEQLRNSLAFAEELRVSRLQLSERMPLQQIDMFLKELLRAILLGPLSQLLDETFTPEVEEELDLSHDEPVSTKANLRDFLQSLLVLYNSEKIAYDSAIVKNKIAKDKEVEKQRFIQYMDKMTDEERQMDVIKRRLGLGRWAVGGSKLTFQYDADYWEQQRQERMDNYGAAVGVEGLPLPQGEGGREDVGEGYDLDYNIDE